MLRRAPGFAGFLSRNGRKVRFFRVRHSLALLRRFLGAALLGLVALTTGIPGAAISPVDAQYGGISALFVSTSPDRPGFADFSGIGCNGGEEVVLYWPGLAPTSQDPAASQSVPGRILAVTQSVASDDPLLNGTFTFPNVRLPDVPPGVYEVHTRCGDLDMRVLIQVSDDGVVTIDPDPNVPIINETPPNDPNNPGATPGTTGQLPLTGSEPNRIVSLGAGFIAAGIVVMALSRRHRRA